MLKLSPDEPPARHSFVHRRPDGRQTLVMKVAIPLRRDAVLVERRLTGRETWECRAIAGSADDYSLELLDRAVM